MKILLLTTHLEMGGISIYVANLARGLKRRGHDPIVASSGGWFEPRLEESHIPHCKIPCRTSSELNPKLWCLVFPQLLALIRRERPDLIHAHTRVTQALAWILSGVTGVPYVTTCHGFYRYRIGRRLFRCWGKTVMAISDATMDLLVRQYRLAIPREVRLILSGIPLDQFSSPVVKEEIDWFRQTLGLKGKPVIGAIARLSPVKGLEFLLKAVPGLRSDFPQLQVLLVGEGPAKPDLVRLAYELGIADRVVISHPVEDTRIPLASMDLFIAPSLQEGFGLAIVEAMAAGVPVVASDSGGPTEIIRDGESGFLIPPADASALESAIRTVLKDPDQRARIAREAREQARIRFDMDRVIQEVEQVYAQAVA